MNRRKIGSGYEHMAGRYLEELGYRILTYNYYCRFGEIDIVAEDHGYLVFVEVKYRAAGGHGLPEEAVTPAKQRKIRKTAEYYLIAEHVSSERFCRFDVVAIEGEEIRLIRNAFS